MDAAAAAAAAASERAAAACARRPACGCPCGRAHSPAPGAATSKDPPPYLSCSNNSVRGAGAGLQGQGAQGGAVPALPPCLPSADGALPPTCVQGGSSGGAQRLEPVHWHEACTARCVAGWGTRAHMPLTHPAQPPQVKGPVRMPTRKLVHTTRKAPSGNGDAGGRARGAAGAAGRSAGSGSQRPGLAADACQGWAEGAARAADAACCTVASHPAPLQRTLTATRLPPATHPHQAPIRLTASSCACTSA